jgi:hypothetical protein
MGEAQTGGSNTDGVVGLKRSLLEKLQKIILE